MILKRLCAAQVVFAVCALLGAASAQAQVARSSTVVDAEIAADRSLVWEQVTEATLLSPAAVQAFSTTRLSVAHGETLEILEAYTRKADGRIVPVEPSEIATQDGAVGAAITFLDVKIRQVPFREVSTGDVTVLRTRLTRREHYFPGQVSYFFAPPRDGVEREITLNLRTPAAISIRHDEKDYGYEEAREGDTTRRRWSGKTNLAPVTEALATDLQVRGPHFSYSTFDSYERIGLAYGDAAAPKMQATPKVRALAEQITAGKPDPAAQADAILQWVSRNIRYVAVYFGAGRVVPNEVDVVLARGYGDCKDKVGLTTALLAAKGIPAEQVLIQTGASYALPETPLQQAFNHIIVYLPGLDRYGDPTDPRSALGSLSNVLAGKPVIRISARPEGVAAVAARTPIRSADDNVARITGRLRIEPEGFKQSEAEIEASGEFAHVLRAYVGNAETRGKDVAAADLLRTAGVSGEATLEAPNSLDLSEPYRVGFKWIADRAFPLPSNGWRPGNVLAPLTAAPTNFVASLEPKRRAFASMCRPGRMTQDYAIALPEGASLKAVPEPVEVQGPSFIYKRRWTLEGQTLRDQTEVVASFDTRACAPETVQAIAEAFDRAKERVNPALQITFAEGVGR